MENISKAARKCLNDSDEVEESPTPQEYEMQNIAGGSSDGPTLTTLEQDCVLENISPVNSSCEENISEDLQEEGGLRDARETTMLSNSPGRVTGNNEQLGKFKPIEPLSHSIETDEQLNTSVNERIMSKISSSSSQAAISKDSVHERNFTQDSHRTAPTDELENVPADEVENVPADEVENVPADEVENVPADEVAGAPAAGEVENGLANEVAPIYNPRNYRMGDLGNRVRRGPRPLSNGNAFHMVNNPPPPLPDRSFKFGIIEFSWAMTIIMFVLTAICVYRGLVVCETVVSCALYGFTGGVFGLLFIFFFLFSFCKKIQRTVRDDQEV